MELETIIIYKMREEFANGNPNRWDFLLMSLEDFRNLSLHNTHIEYYHPIKFNPQNTAYIIGNTQKYVEGLNETKAEKIEHPNSIHYKIDPLGLEEDL